MRLLTSLSASAACLAAVVLVPWSCKEVPLPTLEEFLARASDRLPGWHVTRTSHSEVYLHRQPVPIGELRSLPALTDHLGRWKGIVRIDASHTSPRALRSWMGGAIDRWREHGCVHVVGRLVVFGDPAAIKAIKG